MNRTNYYQQLVIKPISVIVKYYDDGYVTEHVADDEGHELYLLKQYKHPSGKSPVVKVNLETGKA